MAMALIGNMAKRALPSLINWGAEKLGSTLARTLGDNVVGKAIKMVLPDAPENVMANVA